METAAQVEARLRAEHPFLDRTEDGKQQRLTEEEYEARIAEMVAGELERLQHLADLNLSEQELTAIKARYKALKAGTLTSAQVQDTLARLLKYQFNAE